MRDEEVEKLEEQARWWETVGDVLGYRLSGWTGKHSASFVRDDLRKTVLQLNGLDAERLLKYAVDNDEEK